MELSEIQDKCDFDYPGFHCVSSRLPCYAPWLVNWFGRLPGDIRIQNEKSFVFIPIVSMLVVGIILTLIVNLFFRK